MSRAFIADPVCRLIVTTHCLVPYAGSGMPFENYVTDATDGGVQGVKLQGDGGMMKPLK